MNPDIILNDISTAIKSLQESPNEDAEYKIKTLIVNNLKTELEKMNIPITNLLVISNYLSSLYSLTDNPQYYDLTVLIMRLIQAYRHTKREVNYSGLKPRSF